MTIPTSKQEHHQQQHAKYVLSSWAVQGSMAQAPVAVRGEGRFFWDEDGNKYLDLASGLVSTNLGHGHPKVVKAIQDQAAQLCYAPTSYLNDKRAELGGMKAAARSSPPAARKPTMTPSGWPAR
jgi:taurine---2-oxoglutarate transaminase